MARINYFKTAPQAMEAMRGLEEYVDLTMAIVAINGWNRIAIGFRSEAGSYQPRKVQKGNES